MHSLDYRDPRATFTNHVRHISEFMHQHPDAATRAFLDNSDRLEDVENILRDHIGDGVGARLRVTFDRFYQNGFYELLFESLLGEARQGVMVNQVEHAVANLLIQEWGEEAG